MDNEDFYYNLLFGSEYSSDRGEDYVENLEVDDLTTGQRMLENDYLRIKFRKSVNDKGIN
jgi:hypothetical protein